MNTIGWAIVYAAITWELKGRVNEMDKDSRILSGILIFYVLVMMTISTVSSFFKL